MPDPRPVTISPADPPRLTYRLHEIHKCIGVSRRTLERLRAAGRFPAPDVQVGKIPLWSAETLQRWVKGGGRCAS